MTGCVENVNETPPCFTLVYKRRRLVGYNIISDTVFMWQKRSESPERQTRPIQSNSANTDATRPIQTQLTQLGQYRRNSADTTRPITTDDRHLLLLLQPMKTWRTCFNRQLKYKVKLINKIVISQVISY